MQHVPAAIQPATSVCSGRRPNIDLIFIMIAAAYASTYTRLLSAVHTGGSTAAINTCMTNRPQLSCITETGPAELVYCVCSPDTRCNIDHGKCMSNPNPPTTSYYAKETLT
jgi:hypothetical protein